MGTEDKNQTEKRLRAQDEDTKKLEYILCAAGIVDPLLNKPLWPSHKYIKDEKRPDGLYCSVHQTIYDRIMAQRRLDGLDGQA